MSCGRRGTPTPREESRSAPDAQSGPGRRLMSRTDHCTRYGERSAWRTTAAVSANRNGTPEARMPEQPRYSSGDRSGAALSAASAVSDRAFVRSTFRCSFSSFLRCRFNSFCRFS